MKATERYLQQATHGLWGQHKRNALAELRGAVEDKVYRHRLGGLSEADATLAALRDLGSPHAIAQELNRVHTAPSALRAALLLGIAGGARRAGRRTDSHDSCRTDSCGRSVPL